MKNSLIFGLAILLNVILTFSAKATLVDIPDANFRAYLQATYPSCFVGNQMETTCAGVVNETTLTVSGKNIADLTGLEYFINITTLDCSNNKLTILPALPSKLLGLYSYNNQLTVLPTLPALIRVLYCNNNQLTSLPSLPSTLLNLQCQFNQLSSLPVLPASLTYLQCNNNLLTILPDMPAKLQQLQCHFNQLTSIPSLPSTLFRLYCFNNQLISLPTLPTNLTSLYCYNNSLNSLPVLPAILQQLQCQFNQLSVLPTLPNSLTDFYCQNNQLTSLPSLPTSLNNLNCQNNQLASLPALPGSLTQISCQNNQLSTLPTLPANLQGLNCLNNKINTLPALPSTMIYLNCQNNLLSILPTLPNSLCNLYCDGNSITCLPNIPTCANFNSSCGTNVCRSITTLPITPVNICPNSSVNISFTITGTYNSGNIFTAQLSDASGSFANPTNLGTSTTAGSISGFIPSTTIAGNTYKIRVVSSSPVVIGSDNGSNLTVSAKPADINITGPTTVPASATGVVYSVPNNPGSVYIWTIPVGASIESGGSPGSTITINFGTSSGQVTVTEQNGSGCYGNLSVLNISTSSTLVNIPDPNFRAALKVLYPTCFNGEWLETTCPGVLNATALDVSGKNIADLTGIQYFGNLRQLFCYSNQLTSLPPLPVNLIFLYANTNQLTSLPVLPATLKYLYVSDNKFSSLPSLPPALEQLFCANNQLTSLPQLPSSMQAILCNGNQLVNLPALPPSLTQLMCYNNLLTSLPALPSLLSELYCLNNKLNSLPTLPNSLCTLQCSGNSITCLPNIPTCSTFVSTCGTNLCTSITTSAISPVSFCTNSTLTISFTVTGTYNSGNIFTAQLSDASGSFANPSILGTSSSAGTISGVIPSNTSAGTAYRIRVISSSPAIIGTDNGTNLTVLSGPSTSVISGPSSVCIGAPDASYSVISTPGSSYNWTVPNGYTIVSGNGTSSITVKFGTGSGTISVVETNSNTCTGAPTSLNVIINPLPVTSVITGPAAVCSGVTGVSYSVVNTIGSTYEWTVPTGAIIASGAGTSTIAVNFNTTGGAVSVVETNANGCTGIAQTIQVSINPLPVTSVITGPVNVCENATSVAYSVTAVSGSTFNWTLPAGASIASGTGTASVKVNFGTTPGNISVVQTNSKGCSSIPSSISVTLKPQPATTITSSSTTICAGATVSLTAGGANTYAWTASAGLTVNATSPNLATAKPTISKSYTVTGTGTNGCSKAASVFITVNPLPVITINPAAPTICKGNSVTLTASGAASYAWTGSPFTGSGSTIVANPIVNTTYKVTGTSSQGCTAAKNVTVSVSVVPVPLITASCNTLSTTAAGVNYQWNLEGNPITGASANTYNPAACGNYSLTATNSYGCFASSAPYYVVGTSSPSALRTASSNTTGSNADFSLYPNPNDGSFSLITNCKVQVIDINGKVVYENVVTDLNELKYIDSAVKSSGTYVVQLKIGETIISKKMLVIE